jgi:hypothetical protein
MPMCRSTSLTTGYPWQIDITDGTKYIYKQSVFKRAYHSANGCNISGLHADCADDLFGYCQALKSKREKCCLELVYFSGG